MSDRLRALVAAVLLLSCGGDDEWRGTVAYPDGPVRCICWGPTVQAVNDCLRKACP